MFYALLALALTISIINQGTLALVITSGLAIILLLAVFSTDKVLNNLQVTLELSSTHLFAGETAEATLRVTNPSRFPIIWLYIRQNLPVNLEQHGDSTYVTSLGAGETRSFTFSLGSLHRGIYTFGPVILECGDILGLYRRRDERSHGTEITVYPVIHKIPELPSPSRIPFGTPSSLKTFIEDPVWVKGVRDYEPGDPLSRVNWKASARLHKLQVKELQPAVNLDSVVVLNLDPADYPNRQEEVLGELAIETAASIISELCSRHSVFRIITNQEPDISVSAGRAPSDLTKFLNPLSLITMAPGIPIEKTARKGINVTGMGSVIYIITPRVTDELTAACYALVRAGRCPVIIHITPRDRGDKGLAGILKRTPITYIKAQRGLAHGSLELKGEVSGV